MARNRSLGTQALLGLILLVAMSGLGCREYPPVTTRESQDLIKLVYTASNTRSEPRLAECERRLNLLIEEKKISDIEKAAFQKIIQQAKQGDWQAAQDEALQFARDQVR